MTCLRRRGCRARSRVVASCTGRVRRCRPRSSLQIDVGSVDREAIGVVARRYRRIWGGERPAISDRRRRCSGSGSPDSCSRSVDSRPRRPVCRSRSARPPSLGRSGHRRSRRGRALRRPRSPRPTSRSRPLTRALRGTARRGRRTRAMAMDPRRGLWPFGYVPGRDLAPPRSPVHRRTRSRATRGARHTVARASPFVPRQRSAAGFRSEDAFAQKMMPPSGGITT